MGKKKITFTPTPRQRAQRLAQDTTDHRAQSETLKCQIKNSSADQWQKKLFWAKWQLFVAKNDCVAANRQWTFICQAASCWKM